MVFPCFFFFFFFVLFASYEMAELMGGQQWLITAAIGQGCEGLSMARVVSSLPHCAVQGYTSN